MQVRVCACMDVSPTLNVCISVRVCVCVCARAHASPSQCLHECEGMCARLLLSQVSLYA